MAAARIALGMQEKLKLGNLNAKRDWGFAPEYVEGMWRMLQQNSADDFVLATGETHQVREFVDAAFSELGLEVEWQGENENEKGISRKTGKTLIEIDPRYYRPTEVDLLIGDSKKAKEKLGWQAKTTFSNLARLMAKADLELIKKRGY
jgi:GDPmannose 4,6-dehydratase